MAKNPIPTHSDSNICLYLFFTLYCVVCGCCLSYGQVRGDAVGRYNAVTLSSFTYARTALKPYDWRYIRVDLPPWFSSVDISLDSDVDIDLEKIRKSPKSSMPIICFREGSPPLPDVYNISATGLVLDYVSNGSFVQDLQLVEKCYPMQSTIFLKLTNEQIPSGVWYIGLFNGVGPMRTQSKMINRGSAYSFSGNITVEGCTTSAISGQFCNQSVTSLSCLDGYSLPEIGLNGSSNQSTGNVMSCKVDDSCHGYRDSNVYSFDIVGITERVILTASNVRFNQSQSSNSTKNGSHIPLMIYARYRAMPLTTLHDYSGHITDAPLVMLSPKIGRWYIIVQPANVSEMVGKAQDVDKEVCYSLQSQILQCPVDKAGLNCTWERYMLQTVLRKNPTVPFESYYLPISDKVSSDSANFPLEPLLTNTSNGGNNDVVWTFFLIDIPSGATGGNIHIRLSSDSNVGYEIYARYGGLPSINSWDYFYANSTSNSNGSMFFKLYDTSDTKVSFYILYAIGGTWSFGLRHKNPSNLNSMDQTIMSISLERCPQKCSSHGTCQSLVDASGLTLYSYCACDRNHGGFDCSVELVSHLGMLKRVGHMWQSIALIASNAAALLPAYWSLRRKAFAEWVLFTSSGISSGLYHACDVGTWCALTFHVLQFLDFWLSFMAVVSTFVYLATISEISKRTIHTVVAILTALMAETGPTRSSNIIIVVAIGAAGLLVGLLIEFFTRHRMLSFSTEICLNLLHRWEGIKTWIRNLIKTLLKRFRWGFLLAGFMALAMAAVSWKLETSESYWIWHSLWHISIYTSSFLFLCSKVDVPNPNCENEQPRDGSYELTRQNSFTGEQRDDR
nr:Transmembrane protein like [Ipomoea batatas]